MPKSFLLTNRRYVNLHTCSVHYHEPKVQIVDDHVAASSGDDATDSDSSCSTHHESRHEVSSDIEYGFDCTDHHSSFLLDLMQQSPMKASFREFPESFVDYRPKFDQSKVFEKDTNLLYTFADPENRDPNAIGLGEIYTCIDCGKRYSTSSNLARHRQTHRSVNDKKARKCPHCEKVYVSMPAYSMHVRTHNQGCECPYCSKKFSRPWLLQGHIRTHTGEKPFLCSKCPKAFADKSNLRAHIQTHSADKPYVCGRCGKAFALKSYLYKHEESSCMRGQRFRH